MITVLLVYVPLQRIPYILIVLVSQCGDCSEVVVVVVDRQELNDLSETTQAVVGREEREFVDTEPRGAVLVEAASECNCLQEEQNEVV